LKVVVRRRADSGQCALSGREKESTMRSSLAVLAAVALGLRSVTAVAAPAESPARYFEGKDLFGVQVATDPQIRPDGGAVAYVRVSYEIMTDAARRSIWLIDTASGVQTPLVSGASSNTSPRWSPDGERLAYVSTAENGRAQLFVRWIRSGASARIAEFVEAPKDLTWSHDGKWIAFTMFVPDDKSKLGSAPAKPEGAQWAGPLEVITDVTYRADGAGYLKAGYSHLYVVPADGGSPRQLTFGAFNEGGPLAWSSDDKTIVLNGNRLEGWQREPVNSELYEVGVSDGSITALTTRKGPDFSPAISPDGKQLAFLGFDDRLMGSQKNDLYVMDRSTRKTRSLTEKFDRSIDDVQWAADGRGIYVRYDDQGTTHVGRIALDGKLTDVTSGLTGAGLDRPYTGGEFTVSNNGTVAVTSGTPQRPADIAIVQKGSKRQLTHLNEGLLGTKTLGDVSTLAVKSSFDQRAIAAWVVKPPQFEPGKKYPLILEIHGGPFSAYGPVFSTDDQLYAAAGYVVVYVNPRGSTSYGDEFANLIHHDYPSHDYDDLISAVDAAIAQGYVDDKNLFVTGGSGGGVLTAWIIGRTQRFKAAATQKPVINWTSTVLTTDGYTYMPKYWFAKLPWDDPESYWKRSPLSLVGAVTTPTLVIVGDQDFRTPVSESEQYYAALQLRGVPTALVKVPGASHGGLAARPSQSAAKASAILAWFEQYRGKQ
jgi:dipeptidyl aminopeptidase/acylaminoacyl peptidase